MEDVEIMRQAITLAPTEPEALYAILDPAVEWDTTRQVPDGEVVHGVSAVRSFFRRWLGPLADYAFECDEIAEAGDHVFVLMRQRAKGKGSGAPVEGLVAQLWTLRAGKVVRYRGFQSRAEALVAAGLPGQEPEATDRRSWSSRRP